jgi:hypothetical protein
MREAAQRNKQQIQQSCANTAAPESTAAAAAAEGRHESSGATGARAVPAATAKGKEPLAADELTPEMR